MSSARTIDEALRNPTPGEPPWGIAQLFEEQGEWTEEAYLAIDRNILIEFADGCLEFPPMPTDSHQALSDYLLDALKAFIRPRQLGTIRYAPLRVRIRPQKYREPDILFLRAERDHLRGEKFWQSADLVVEIVSDDDPNRDWVTKLADYAEAGIPEYWIADPRDQTLTVFTLEPGATSYREAGRYRRGDTAKSVLLDGLTIDVAAAFDQR